jgi:hypothetical protein
MSLNLTEQPGGLICVDVDRRTYIAPSSDGSYYHHIEPLRPDVAGFFEATELIGAVQVGELICSCAGGRFKHNCYRLEQARDFERRLAEDLRWGIDLNALPGEAVGRASRARAASPASPNPAHRSKGTTGRRPQLASSRV